MSKKVKIRYRFKNLQKTLVVDMEVRILAPFTKDMYNMVLWDGCKKVLLEKYKDHPKLHTISILNVEVIS